MLLLPVLFAGCTLASTPFPAQTARRTAPPPRVGSSHAEVANEPAYATQEGLASWYGRPFHGRPAASGELFDQNKMTAAHRSLPFGTWVRVIDLDTGQSIKVRINDRGPYVKDRILDLSRAAGIALGIGERGVAKIRMEVLDPQILAIPPRLFALQVAAFKYKGRAQTYIDTKLGGIRFSEPVRPYLKPPGRLSKHYRVRFGPFTDRASARAATRKLRSEGFDSMLIQEGPEMFPSYLKGTSGVQVAVAEENPTDTDGSQPEATVAASSQAR